MIMPHGPSQSGSGDDDRGTDSIKRFDAVWTMVEREGGAYAQWEDVERLMDDVDSWEQSFAAIEAQRDRLKKALREIKLTCLTALNARGGLAKITRLCIDAGVTEHLDELEAKP